MLLFLLYLQSDYTTETIILINLKKHHIMEGNGLYNIPENIFLEFKENKMEDDIRQGATAMFSNFFKDVRLCENQDISENVADAFQLLMFIVDNKEKLTLKS